MSAGIYKEMDSHLYKMTISELKQVSECYQNLRKGL
ncbi:Fur-regulated basic protein FbpA [Bacillus sp. 165]|nr:Fur-regulated basic protein FbpA [Bacillus sp. 165]